MESFGKSLLDLPKLILFLEIWGLQKLFYEKWIFHQSRTKTATKTNIAKQSKKDPNHRLLVHNLHTTKQKKTKKGRTSFGRLQALALGNRAPPPQNVAPSMSM